MALATSWTSASFMLQRKAFQEFHPMAGVLPTPAQKKGEKKGHGNGRLWAPFALAAWR